SDAALGMFEALTADASVTAFTGDQLGGIFGALDPADIGTTVSSELLLESTEKMTIEHYVNVGGEQAGAMFETLGSDQVMALGGEQVAGMFSAMEGEQLADLGGATIADAIIAMGTENAVDMGAGNIAEVVGSLGTADMATVGGDVLVD
ncbi:MAG: hypothetical protein VYC44_11335, partial [Chloroflexota bacterium]|nr:hypothetical protein [Chloroflexota bacterium]